MNSKVTHYLNNCHAIAQNEQLHNNHLYPKLLLVTNFALKQSS